MKNTHTHPKQPENTTAKRKKSTTNLALTIRRRYLFSHVPPVTVRRLSREIYYGSSRPDPHESSELTDHSGVWGSERVGSTRFHSSSGASRVGSCGALARNLMSRVRSGQEVFPSRGSGRVVTSRKRRGSKQASS